MELKNKKLTDDEFFKERADVLTHWETGKEVDFQEAVDYQKSIAPEKRFSYKLQKEQHKKRGFMMDKQEFLLILLLGKLH